MAFAVVALFAIPASAGATFGISGFAYTQTQLTKNASGVAVTSPSPTQAGAHPFTTISFSRTGAENEDLQNVLLDLPTGVFPNPEAANAKCTTASWQADTCASTAPNSQVGNISMDITAASTLNLTAPGTINMITPDPGQVATLGLTVRPAKICILFIFCAVPDKVFLKTGITVKTYEDSGVRTYTPGAPHTTSIAIPPIVKSGALNLDITVKKLTLNFQSRANATKAGSSGTTTVYGTGPYFWTNTTSCDLATAKVDISSYSNVHATSTASFTPTGCPAVPFAPTVGFVPPKYDPSSPQTAPTFLAGQAGPITFKLNVPEADATIQNSLPRIVDVDFPVGSGLDLNALSGVTACSEDQLKASACPASSIIGNANAFSKYLPNPTVTSPLSPGLTGNIYAMSVGNQIDVGVQLVGPRNTIVIFRGTLGTRGDANVGTGRVYGLFNRIPQLPFSSFTLNIAKPVFKNPDTCGSNSLSTALTGFSGATASQSGAYTTSGCAAAPDTTITNGPPSTTTNKQPTFTFTSTAAGATFQCKTDQIDPTTGAILTAGSYSLCTSPFTSPTLVDGKYTFSVQSYNGLTPDPTPATNTFTVATGPGYTIATTVTPSTTQAAAHPDLSSTVNVSNGQPKQVSIKLPAGLNASLTSVPRCSTADAAAGNCAAASKIGTLQVTANSFGGSISGLGDVFLTDAPTATDAGGVAVKVPLAGGFFIAQGGAYLVNNGNNQNLEIRNFPTNVNGTDITITQLVLGLSGANRFLTNPSNCSATDGFVINSTAFDGSLASPTSVAFQATGCTGTTAPPFVPAFNITLSSLAAASLTGITADLSVPIDNSTVKTLRVTLPPSLGPNFPSFGASADQCPSASAASPTSVFNPTGCPPQSLVGSLDITTPLLPTVLHGDVYLINKSPLPWFGVKFDQPGISVRLVGVTATPQVVPTCDPATDPNGFCQSQISAVFNNLPDVPLSHVTFSLNGPDRTGTGGPLSGKLLVVASPGDASCAPGPAKSVISPYTGTPSPAPLLTQTISPTGC